MISYDLWTRLFSADRNIASGSITLNRQPYRIVGVAPAGFHGLDSLYSAEVWVPFTMYEQLHPFARYVTQRRFLAQSVVGRLKAGRGRAASPGGHADPFHATWNTSIPRTTRDAGWC